jgi:hypothetical protein
VERILDDFEATHPAIRVVRLRPGLISKAGAASGIRRLFAGPLLPTPLLRRGLIAVIPALDRLRFQGVHSLDVGEAYHQAVVRDVSGPFNIAADPILDPDELGRLSAPGLCRSHRERHGQPCKRAGSCGCSRHRLADWTSRSACR